MAIVRVGLKVRLTGSDCEAAEVSVKDSQRGLVRLTRGDSSHIMSTRTLQKQIDSGRVEAFEEADLMPEDIKFLEGK